MSLYANIASAIKKDAERFPVILLHSFLQMVTHQSSSVLCKLAGGTGFLFYNSWAFILITIGQNNVDIPWESSILYVCSVDPILLYKFKY